MKYTVVWHADALTSLTGIWLAATDRKAIAELADSIDRMLKQSPYSYSHLTADQLRCMRVDSLEVLFEIHDDDRIVNLIAARHVARE